MKRRNFFKLIGIVGLAAFIPAWLFAEKNNGPLHFHHNAWATGVIPVRVWTGTKFLGENLVQIVRYDVCVKRPDSIFSGNRIKLRDYYFKQYHIDITNATPKEEKRAIAKLLSHVRNEGFSLKDIVPLELSPGVDAKIIYV